MADQPELPQISQLLAAQSKQQAQSTEIRSDPRTPKNEVLTDPEERLRRLEDFMRRAS